MTLKLHRVQLDRYWVNSQKFVALSKKKSGFVDPWLTLRKIFIKAMYVEWFYLHWPKKHAYCKKHCLNKGMQRVELLILLNEDLKTQNCLIDILLLAACSRLMFLIIDYF
jgi:hypothetical protein